MLTKDQQQQLDIKVFSRWVADKLKFVKGVVVEDITTDFSNGIVILHLANKLTKKIIPKNLLNKQSISNKNIEISKIDYAISMFNKAGIIFGVAENSISGEEIYNGVESQILFMIWTLIKKYSIDKSVHETLDYSFDKKYMYKGAIENGNNFQLLQWAKDKVSSYKNMDKNFRPFSLGMCALFHSYLEKEFKRPGRIDYDSLNKDDHEKNLQIAVDFMEEYEIPVYIRPEDIKQFNYQVDEASLMTQLSAIKIFLDIHFKNRDSYKPQINENLANQENAKSYSVSIRNLPKLSSNSRSNTTKNSVDDDNNNQISSNVNTSNDDQNENEKNWHEKELKERQRLLDEQKESFLKEIENIKKEMKKQSEIETQKLLENQKQKLLLEFNAKEKSVKEQSEVETQKLLENQKQKLLFEFNAKVKSVKDQSEIETQKLLENQKQMLLVEFNAKEKSVKEQSEVETQKLLENQKTKVII